MPTPPLYLGYTEDQIRTVLQHQIKRIREYSHIDISLTNPYRLGLTNEYTLVITRPNAAPSTTERSFATADECGQYIAGMIDALHITQRWDEWCGTTNAGMVCTKPKGHDIVQDIMAAAALAKPWEWEPDHPQYIEGRLWLTPEQWDALCEAAPDYDREKWAARPTLAWGIPVELIQPDEPVTLPSGRTLVYLPTLRSLLVSDPPPWVKYDAAGPGVTQVGRTRL